MDNEVRILKSVGANLLPLDSTQEDSNPFAHQLLPVACWGHLLKEKTKPIN